MVKPSIPSVEDIKNLSVSFPHNYTARDLMYVLISFEFLKRFLFTMYIFYFKILNDFSAFISE